MKRLLLSGICACAWVATAEAHVLDQYLQAARIAIARDGARVELRLTPGAQAADRVFAMMDADGDGRLSAAEQQGYAQRVLRDLSLDVDGRRVPLALAAVHFPSRDEMRGGLGEIRLDLAVDAALGAGPHQAAFRNDHLPELGVYLANALVPVDPEIRITGQERDALQHGLRIDFTRTPATPTHGRSYRMGGMGALIAGSCLALGFLQRKRLRR